MPPRGAAARGEAKATLAGVLHERICDERFGEAIAELGGDASLGEFERARVREARRERDRAVRVPATLVRELAQAESAGFEAWQVARAESDFSLFRDPLERLVSLRREEADAVGYEGGERYDALLDQYEPDMRVARLEPLLHGLRDELVPFVQEIAARPRPDDAFVRRTYPARSSSGPSARAWPRDRLRLRGRAARRGGAPVRLRLRARRRAPDDARARERPLLRPLRGAARGRPRPLRAGPRRATIEGTFCGTATSLGLHESQSRFWENMVGRSRAVLGAPPGRGSRPRSPSSSPTSRSTRSCARPTSSSRR